MWGWQSCRSDNCLCGCVWLSLFEVREVARLANYLGIDPWARHPSTSLRVSSEGGEWGNNTAIYSANSQSSLFCFPQTAGVLNYYNIASNILNIHWHFNLVYHGELENLMSDTLTQGSRSLTEILFTYLYLCSMGCVLIVWLLTQFRRSYQNVILCNANCET